MKDNRLVVLVTGSRSWDNIEVIAREMGQFSKDTIFVHGYANGADSVCHIVGKEMGFEIIPCPAHWRHNETRWVEVHGPCSSDCKEVVGKAAGVIRNRYMLKTHNPDIVLAFHDDIEHSKGTKDMVTIAKQAGKEVRLFIA